MNCVILLASFLQSSYTLTGSDLHATSFQVTAHCYVIGLLTCMNCVTPSSNPPALQLAVTRHATSFPDAGSYFSLLVDLLT